MSTRTFPVLMQPETRRLDFAYQMTKGLHETPGKDWAESEEDMNDEQKKEMVELALEDGVELTDEMLDSLAGGFIYHDAGNPALHRKEAFYVLNSDKKLVMTLPSMEKAEHWARNLRTSLQQLSEDEFQKLALG